MAEIEPNPRGNLRAFDIAETVAAQLRAAGINVCTVLPDGWMGRYKIGSTDLDGPELRCQTCLWERDGLYGFTLPELLDLAREHEATHMGA